MRKAWTIAAAALALAAPAAARGKSQPTTESCGWATPSAEGLSFQADPGLRPLKENYPLPTPPQRAVAAYCDRDSIVFGEHDYRVIRLGLPLIIREGGRVGVLSYPPQVSFDWEFEKGRYVRRDPSKPPKGEVITAQTPEERRK